MLCQLFCQSLGILSPAHRAAAERNETARGTPPLERQGPRAYDNPATKTYTDACSDMRTGRFAFRTIRGGGLRFGYEVHMQASRRTFTGSWRRVWRCTWEGCVSHSPPQARKWQPALAPNTLSVPAVLLSSPNLTSSVVATQKPVSLAHIVDLKASAPDGT